MNRKYIQITNEEQRAKYKADFYHEYEEYRRLHRYIEDVANKFSELGIRLNTKTEGSEEWSVSLEKNETNLKELLKKSS
ncbi:hypothetical protein ACXIU3_24200, partial [Vibrio parahaemolyticus]